MEKRRFAATFALLLFLFAAAPSFAFQRDRGPQPVDPIDRIIRFVKKIVSPIVNPIAHILDDPSIPKP